MAETMKVVKVEDLRIKATNRLWEGKEDKKEDKVVTIDHEEFQRSRQSMSDDEMRVNDRIKENKERQEEQIKDLKITRKHLNESMKEQNDIIDKLEETREADAETIADLKNAVLAMKKELEEKKSKKEKKEDKKEAKDGQVS